MPDSPAAGCWLYTLKKMGRKFLEKRPNSAFSSSKNEEDATGFWNDLIQEVGSNFYVSVLSANVHFSTGGAALVDESA